jgi:hypothetical protein
MFRPPQTISLTAVSRHHERDENPHSPDVHHLVPWLRRHANAQQLLSGEREARVTAIPNVIAANAKWELVWAGFETADGIVGTSDGGVLFAQEQTDTIRKLDVTGREFVYLTDTHASSRRRVHRLRSRFPGATRRRSTSRSSASSVRTENHGKHRRECGIRR